MHRIISILVAATLAVILAGCAESSLARRDTITPFAYNTQASNIATQAVNPAEPRAYDRHIGLDGAYGDKAVRTRLARAVPVASSGSPSSSPSSANANPTTGGGTTGGGQ